MASLTCCEERVDDDEDEDNTTDNVSDGNGGK
jgi:hypothetical protein